MRRPGYCDLHVHTNRSDAMSIWTPEKVLLRARDMGITHVALADHNIVNEDWMEQSEKCDVDVICSTEMSAELIDDDVKFEPHIVGFRVNPFAEAIRGIAAKHQQSRDSYLTAILDGLRADPYDPIDISLEELKKKNHKSLHIGRVHIGEVIIEKGKAKNMREVYNRYLGKESGAPSYVDSREHLIYEKVEIVVRGIIDSGGLPIVAHPPYNMTEKAMRTLLGIVKDVAGPLACMETEYGDYTKAEVERLKALAKYYGMTESTGSDFHGYEGLDLKQGSEDIYRTLQDLWEVHCG